MGFFSKAKELFQKGKKAIQQGFYKLGEAEAKGLQRIGILSDESKLPFRQPVVPQSIKLDGKAQTHSINTSPNVVPQQAISAPFEIHVNPENMLVPDPPQEKIMPKLAESVRSKINKQIASDYAAMGETKKAKGIAYAEYYDNDVKFDTKEDFYEQLEADMNVVADEIETTEKRIKLGVDF